VLPGRRAEDGLGSSVEESITECLRVGAVLTYKLGLRRTHSRDAWSCRCLTTTDPFGRVTCSSKSCHSQYAVDGGLISVEDLSLCSSIRQVMTSVTCAIVARYSAEGWSHCSPVGTDELYPPWSSRSVNH
jgi:hypothetical protein